MTEIVDLNADLGEGAGFDKEILPFISSASISCGLHAGNPASILASIREAQEQGVAVGAHPSFDDRANFGRKELQLPPEEILVLVTRQLHAFQVLANDVGVVVNHVKPHGALYNMAARDRAIADAIAQAVLTVDSNLFVFAPAESQLEIAAVELGLPAMSETFADRNYLADGSLVPRSDSNALLRDPFEAAERVERMVREHTVRAIDGTDIPVWANTICVHGDTPDAVEFVRTLRERLELQEIEIAAPGRPA